ncbi:MAG: FkbM family methyltransferase [Alphaproteobacteria bacterium]|nr:FkbM family methyltransferase [Alphaproteobacteria bacterium]MBU0858742.1 FkbM family methyltransferase [Alphaproteobacteria bacterium]
MSRTVARIIDGFIDVATLPLNRRQREKTTARVAESLDRRSLRTVETTRGALSFYALRGAGTASAVARFHEDEPETLGWIDQYVKPGDTLWDIGGNIGMYALYAGLQDSVKVLTFEPSALNFALLVEHVALNGQGDRVHPLCLALGRETKLDRLHMGELTVGHAMNALGVAESQFNKFKPAFSQAIPALRGDDLCRIFGIAPPTHIKLDVDGIEEHILAGLEHTLPQVKTIVVEVEGNNATAAAAIENPLFAAGFAEEPSHRSRGSQRNRLYINRASII